MQQQLLDFYRGIGADPQGRTLETIWSYSREQLEIVHDYIQWLFPTETPSRHHPLAPWLDPETATAFQQDDFLQSRVLQSLELMLDFFGLNLTRCEVAPTVSPAPHYTRRRKAWQKPSNHNLLRLTRILESLRLLGLARYSLSLYLCLEQLHSQGHIPHESLQIWRLAVALPGPPPPRPSWWKQLLSQIREK